MGGWYLDNTRVFVQDLTVDGKSIIAKLNPLQGGSVYHYWGYEDENINLKCYVVGWTDRDDIKDMQRDGDTHILWGSGLDQTQWNVSMDVYLESVTWEAIPLICQTLRPDLDDDAQTWMADIKLFWDEA